jgi:cysteine synthase A
MRRLARDHGMLVGPSSGANMVAARRLLDENSDDLVVTIMCDEGEKYLSEYFIPEVHPITLESLNLSVP